MTCRAGWLFGGCLLLAACTGVRPDDPVPAAEVAGVYLRKGVAYMERGNYAVARQDLQKALALDPRNSAVHNALAVLAERLEQSAEAMRHFEDALRLDPANLAARNNYARYLCGHGQAREALAQFRLITDARHYAHPQMALTNAGLCAESSGDAATAEHYLRQALALQVDFAPALLAMARISQAAGRSLPARGFLARYLEVAEPEAEALQLGMAIERSLDNDTAVEDYARRLGRRVVP
jgi:type IV pilus assembly protein PilF